MVSESERLSEFEEERVDEEDDDDEDEEEEKDSRDDEEPRRTWSLVCSTKEEWEKLAETFSNSKNKDEKSLHQTLTVDFLAEIARMLEVKVGEDGKKKTQTKTAWKQTTSLWVPEQFTEGRLQFSGCK